MRARCAALAVMAALAVFVLLGIPVVREEVDGIVWGKLSVYVESASLSSPLGVKGLELVYTECSPLGCGGVESVVLPPRPGSGLELGWSLLENIGVRLGDGSYLPAGELLFRGYLVNATWSYPVLRGNAVLRIVVSDVRVASPQACGTHRLLQLVGRAGSICVAAPRAPSSLFEIHVDPVYGRDGVLRVSAGLGLLSRGVVALAVSTVSLLLCRRR